MKVLTSCVVLLLSISLVFAADDSQIQTAGSVNAVQGAGGASGAACDCSMKQVAPSCGCANTIQSVTIIQPQVKAIPMPVIVQPVNVPAPAPFKAPEDPCVADCKEGCSGSSDECEVNCRWKCARRRICAQSCTRSDSACRAKQRRFKCRRPRRVRRAPPAPIAAPQVLPRPPSPPVKPKPQPAPAKIQVPTPRQECKSMARDEADRLCKGRLPASEGRLIQSCILDVCTGGKEALADAMVAMCDLDCANLQCKSQTPFGKHKCQTEQAACQDFQKKNKCICQRQCTDPECMKAREAAGCPMPKAEVPPPPNPAPRVVATNPVPKPACVCSKIFSPVCGVNDQTYGNECQAKCANVEVKYTGRCRPTMCKCTTKAAPVCGLNGITYENRCKAACAGVGIKREGACQTSCTAACPNGPVVCGVDGRNYLSACHANCAQVQVKSQGSCPVDICACNMEDRSPVCGVNGHTYANACQARCAGVNVKAPGACRQGCVCSNRYEPVCGLDGRTHRNKCRLQCRNVALKHNGPCKTGCAKCGQERAPVCGADRQTYGNRCLAECKNVRVQSNGPCAAPRTNAPPPFPGRTGTCRVWGDPHFVAFDGATADFQVSGEYLMAQNALNDDQVLIGLFQGKQFGHLRYVGSVTVRGGGQTLTYQFPNGYDTSRPPSLTVNGQAVSGCGRVGHFSYCGSTGSASVTSAHRLFMTVNWGVHGGNLYMNVDYRAMDVYQRQMSGLCGQFFGTHTAMPWTSNTGVRASLPAVGSSWYVGPGPQPNWPRNGGAAARVGGGGGGCNGRVSRFLPRWRRRTVCRRRWRRVTRKFRVRIRR